MASRGSDIDEQRAGTVHSTRNDGHIHAPPPARPILRPKIFDALGVPPGFLKNADRRRGQCDQSN